MAENLNKTATEIEQIKSFVELLIMDINEFVSEENPVRHGRSYRRLSEMIAQDRAEIKKRWDSLGGFPIDE